MTDFFASRQWLLRDDTHTRDAGLRLAHALIGLPKLKPWLVTMQGELGAGKTTLVSGLLRGLGHVGPVPSPTYTLIEPYEFAGLSLFHLDLYRLTDPQQLEELGWRDLLQPNTLLLVEWPERGGGYLPTADLSVSLAYPETGEGRQLTINTGSESVQQLVDSLVF